MKFTVLSRKFTFILPFSLTGMAEFCQIPLLPISRELGCKSVLVVTDAGVSKLGLTQPLLEGAQRAGLRVTVYDEVLLKSLTWRRNFNLDTLSVGH